MVTVVLASLLLLQSDADEALSRLLQRIDAEDVTERDAAGRDVVPLCRKHGGDWADRLAEKAKGASVDACQRILAGVETFRLVDGVAKEFALIDSAGVPDVRKLRFVEFNTGRWLGRRFHLVSGWLLSEADDEVRLLTALNERHVFKRDRTLPENLPQSALKPGEFAEISYARVCRELVGASEFTIGDHEMDGITQALVNARWAEQRGLDADAAALIRVARDLHAALAKRVPFEEAARDGLALHLFYKAVRAAMAGDARPELAARWKILATALPGNRFEEEAAEQVKGYESLIAEDAAWVDPAPADLDTTAKKAAYWLYKLRDESDRKPVAAAALGELEWDAVPILIGRLDDRRPTRTLQVGPVPFRLTTHRHFIVRALARITAVAPMAEWTSDRIRALWKENGGVDRETHFRRRVRDGDAMSAQAAAVRLLEIDKAKHVGWLFEQADHPETPNPAGLLRILLPHARKEDAAVLEGFLRDADVELLIDVAVVLWEQCGKESGVTDVLERVESPGMTIGDMRLRDLLFERLLPEAASPAAIAAVVRWMKGDERRFRGRALAAAATMADPAVAEALGALLDDATPGVLTLKSGLSCSAGQLAAKSLAELAGCPAVFPAKADVEKAEAFRLEVKEWWSKNKGNVDWAAIRERVRRGLK